MSLYGRGELLRQLASDDSFIVVLAGPPGVGKTSVLKEWQVDSALGAAGTVAPGPVAIRRSPGGLQKAMLDALGEAAASIAAERGAVRGVGEVIVSAAKRLGERRLDNLPAAVARVLLGAVRAKVGAEAAQLVEEFITDLRASADDRLVYQIEAAGSKDVIDVIIDFVERVRSIADGRRIALTLDNAERLDGDDMRRVLDLSDAALHHVQIRFGLMTGPGIERHVDDLTSSGASIVAVGGIDRSAVEEWLAVEAVSATHLDRLMRVTNGYPLHVRDAIGLIKSGGTLSAVAAGNLVSVAVRRAWAALDIEVRRAALALVALPDPAAEDEILSLAGLSDVLEWRSIEHSLRLGGLFAIEVGGRPWFHELHRRVLWDDVLTDADRRRSAENAFGFLEASVLGGNRSAFLFAELGRIARYAEELLEPGTHESEVLKLSRDQIALAASILELADERAQAKVLLASIVLDYAGKRFAMSEEFPAALAGLRDLGMVYVLTQGNQSVVVPTMLGARTALLVAARASDEFSRVPIPSIASRVFQSAIENRIGPFKYAHYGIGKLDLGTLSSYAAELSTKELGGRLHVGRKRQAAVLVRGEFDRVPFYACATYSNSKSRDEAIAALDGLTFDFLGASLSVDDVTSYPTGPIARRRFLWALELLTGWRHIGPFAPDFDRELSLDEEMELRAATVDLVQRRARGVERSVLDLDLPAGVMWAANEDMVLIAEVRGRNGSHRLPDECVKMWHDPIIRAEISKLAGLGAEERIGRMNLRFGRRRREDPIVGALLSLEQQAAKYNQNQPKMLIAPDADLLSAALTFARAQRHEDAEALRTLAPHLFRWWDPYMGPIGIVLGFNAGIGADWPDVFVEYGPIDLGSAGEVIVRVVGGVEGSDACGPFAREFGSRYADRVGVGDASFVIGRMMGHEPNDVQVDIESLIA